MTELIEAAASWRTLLVALVIFGFAPGAVLRLVSLAFRRDDPRRQEMRAELHAVPRIERPFWVAEQMEVALCEGLLERVQGVLAGRVIWRWHLDSGVDLNRRYPDTFWIPDPEDKARITVGTKVKMIFSMRDGWAERMWVEVTEIKGTRYVGELFNHPVGIPRLRSGDKIKFTADDVIDIVEETALPSAKIIDL